jgi:predicted ATPase
MENKRMARIESCEVIGLAGQVTKLIQFNPHINVIFGGNGSGKTSLLKVLHSALDNDLDELKRTALRGAAVTIADVTLQGDLSWYGATNIIRHTPTGYPVEGVDLSSAGLFSLGSIRTREPRRWETIADRKGENGAFDHIYLPISRLYFGGVQPSQGDYAWLSSSPKTEEDFDKKFGETINFLWLRYTRNIGIEIQVEQAAGLRQILYDFLVPASDLEVDAGQFPIADPKQAFNRLLTFLNRQSSFDSHLLNEASFNERMSNDPRVQKVVQDVETVEERVEAIRSPRNELERVFRQMIGGGKKIKLGDTDVHAFGLEGEDIDLGDMSSGEKQLIRIFIDVLLANGQPIIIDEPELSLHIDWQRRLLGTLKRLAPKSQIIVATHSPEIMAEISEEMIIEI